MSIDFRERGREGEKEGEEHGLVTSRTHPNQGAKLQPRNQRALTRNQLVYKTKLQPSEPHWLGPLGLFEKPTFYINVETIMLSEISQLVKDKYHMISLIRGI